MDHPVGAMLELLTPVTIANPATTTEDQCFGTISPASGDAHETDKKTKKNNPNKV